MTFTTIPCSSTYHFTKNKSDFDNDDARTIISDSTEKATSCFSAFFHTHSLNSTKTNPLNTPTKPNPPDLNAKFENAGPFLHPHKILELQNKGRPGKDKKPPMVITPFGIVLR
jgi:hypothetical protein